jgi:hypothetical protein
MRTILKLKVQNTAGYDNGQSTINTTGSIVKGISAKKNFYQGSLSSSKANITVGRFDTVPLIRNFENNLWYGNSREGKK